MRLYEIDAEIQALLDTVDPDTGELTEEAAAQIAALSMDRQQKLEYIALDYKNLQAEADAIKQESKALAERHKAAQKRADSKKAYLSYLVQGDALDTPRVAISFRKSEPVKIDDESQIPKRYIRTTISTVPDLIAIKEAIKSGQTVPGARIEERSNIQIK